MNELWVLVSTKYDEKLGRKVYVFDDPEDAILVQEFFEPTEEMELYTYLEARADFSIAFSLNNAIKRYDSYGSDINLFKEVMEMQKFEKQ